MDAPILPFPWFPLMFHLSLVLLLALLLSRQPPWSSLCGDHTVTVLLSLISLMFPLASLLSLASSVNPFVVGVLSGLLLICSYGCFIAGVPVIATVESLLLLAFLLLLMPLLLQVFSMIKICDMCYVLCTRWVPVPTSLFLPTSFCM